MRTSIRSILILLGITTLLGASACREAAFAAQMPMGLTPGADRLQISQALLVSAAPPPEPSASVPASTFLPRAGAAMSFTQHILTQAAFSWGASASEQAALTRAMAFLRDAGVSGETAMALKAEIARGRYQASSGVLTALDALAQTP